MYSDIEQTLDLLFPELKESEDEITRKSLILYLEYKRKEQEEAKYYQGVEGFERWIAWLKKQKSIEQKSNVIIPKFRVGDEIEFNKESLIITKIDKKGYWSNDLFICDFDEEVCWDLVTQTTTEWSEDERIRKALIRFHKSTIDIDGIKGKEILAWIEKQISQKWNEEMKFRKFDIITNGKIEYEIRDIQKNQLGDWVYILYNASIAKLSSNGSHLPDGSIRRVCKQVDEQFELKQRLKEQ